VARHWLRRDQNLDQGPGSFSAGKRLRRTYALSGVSRFNSYPDSLDIDYLPDLDTNRSVSLPPTRGPIRRKRTSLDKLLQLDSFVRPGLSVPDFRALFVKCTCRVVTTRDAFKNHYCAEVGDTQIDHDEDTDVIDITDSEDETTNSD
jgi:hypothetical protein